MGHRKESGNVNRGSGEPDLKGHAIAKIKQSLASKRKASAMWDLIGTDTVVKTHWQMADFVATRKLGMNDHGATHAMVATSSALTMLDILTESGVKPDIVTGGFGDDDDAALVVLVATLCHDFGNMIHRIDHTDLSVILAIPVLDRLLPAVYPGPVTMTQIKSFILSAIYSHHGEPKPLTIEAALVCIGDSTDMTRGRGRAAFERGSITIHSVSALAIEQVEIRKGKKKPIELRISMSNSAGIFQVQEILAPKVRAGPLADYVEVVAVTDASETDHEDRIVAGIRMEGAKFVPCSTDGNAMK
jgi:metal-dependent HD superfamily phosphatase/phosphodiesterase